MKKPKFNIGDKVRGVITKEVDGIMMTGQIDWYVAAVYTDNGCQFVYRIKPEITNSSIYRHFKEENLVLLEKVQYEDE